MTLSASRLIRSYSTFTLNQIKSGMSYRVSFWISILSRGLTVLVTYYLWKAIYDSGNSTLMEGFNFQEMVGYIIMSFFTATTIHQFSSSMIAFEIADGQIAMNLIKPINYKAYVFSIALGGLIVNTLTTTLPFLSLFLFLSWLSLPSLPYVLLYMLSLCLSFLIMFFFGFCFAMLAFYTTYYFGLNMAKDVLTKFLSGAVIPLVFFPEVIEKILYFLPFASMNYVSVMIWLKKFNTTQMLQAILLQLFWATLFYLLSRFLWQKAIQHLTILGG